MKKGVAMIAKKRHWINLCHKFYDYYFLAYPNNYNYYGKYYKNTFQHGGISLEEMIIPFSVFSPK